MKFDVIGSLSAKGCWSLHWRVDRARKHTLCAYTMHDFEYYTSLHIACGWIPSRRLNHMDVPLAKQIFPCPQETTVIITKALLGDLHRHKATWDGGCHEDKNAFLPLLSAEYSWDRSIFRKHLHLQRESFSENSWWAKQLQIMKACSIDTGKFDLTGKYVNSDIQKWKPVVEESTERIIELSSPSPVYL